MNHTYTCKFLIEIFLMMPALERQVKARDKSILKNSKSFLSSVLLKRNVQMNYLVKLQILIQQEAEQGLDFCIFNKPPRCAAAAIDKPHLQ